MHHYCHFMSCCLYFFVLPAFSLFLPKSIPTCSLVRSLGVFGPLLTLQKKPMKTHTFSTFPIFSRTRPEHICIMLAISRLEAPFSFLFLVLSFSFCSSISFSIFLIFSFSSSFKDTHNQTVEK